MNLDGIIAGAAVFGGGVFVGLLIAHHYHLEQRQRDGDWSRMVQQQQTQIEALQQYIDDHSDGDEETDLRRMFGID
jgi:uncharacterized membrane protein YciS (DUF1049 family)